MFWGRENTVALTYVYPFLTLNWRRDFIVTNPEARFPPTSNSYKRLIILDQERYSPPQKKTALKWWFGGRRVVEQNWPPYILSIKKKNLRMFCVTLTSLCWSQAKVVCLLFLPFLSSWSNRRIQDTTPDGNAMESKKQWTIRSWKLLATISIIIMSKNSFARFNILLSPQKPHNSSH